MKPNLRSLVAKAYRVRQGRTFSSSSSSSSSSAPNPIDRKRYISIYEWLFSRGVVTLTGFGVASYLTGDSVSKFNEEVKAFDKEAIEFLEKRGKLPPGSFDAMPHRNYINIFKRQSNGTLRKKNSRDLIADHEAEPESFGREGTISIYEWLLTRGFVTLTGFGVGKKRFLHDGRYCGILGEEGEAAAWLGGLLCPNPNYRKVILEHHRN